MAEVNLTVEVRSAGIREAADALNDLTGKARSVSAAVRTNSKEWGEWASIVSSAAAKSRTSLSSANDAIEKLRVSTRELRSDYQALGSVMIGATAGDRLRSFGGGSMERGLASARILRQELAAINTDPIRDLEAIEQARASRLSARTNLEKAHWNASIQGMTATQRATLELTQAERAYAKAQKETAAAAPKQQRAPGGAFAGFNEDQLNRHAAAINAEAAALDQVIAKRGQLNALISRSASGVAAAEGTLAAARWNRELAGMTQVEAAQARLTRATEQYARAVRLVEATSRATARNRSAENLDREAAAKKTLARITGELTQAETQYGAAKQRSQAALDAAQNRAASARRDLGAANWERELAGMSQVEAAQARLTRATVDFTIAKSRANLANSVVSRNPTEQAYQRQEAAARSLANATRELTRAEQEHKSAAANKSSSYESDNAFQSSYSYFILAGLAQQASQRIFGMGTASVDASRQIERSFADVERTFEGTGSQLGSLRNRLYELSTETPVSIIDLSEIAALGNQLGIAAADIEKFTTTLAQYSAVSGVTAEDAATAFGRISNLTGIAASEYDKLASAITYTARTTVATESTIQSTAKEITALSSGAGMSASAIVGLAGALSSLAIPPERARGALSLYFGALNTAVSSGGPKLKAFAELTNMTTQELDNLVRSNQGEKVFTAFVKGLSELDTVAKTDALKTLGLGTIRVDQTMRALAQNVPLVTSAFEGAHNAYALGTDLMGQYGIIQDTLDSKIKEFQNSIFNLSAAVGDAGLSTALKAAVEAGTALVVMLTDFANHPIGKAFLGLVTVAMSLVGAFAALVGALSLAKASIVVLGFAMKQLDWASATGGLKLWVANLLTGATATRAAGAAATTTSGSMLLLDGTTTKATTSQIALGNATKGTATGLLLLNGTTTTAATRQLTLGQAVRETGTAMKEAGVGAKLLNLALNGILPILALTLITAGVMKLAEAADKARNPVNALGADVDSLKQALLDDNTKLLASGLEVSTRKSNDARAGLSEFNQSVLAAIDVQRQAEDQFGKTNSAINAQSFELGAGADAWIDEALKSSDAIKSIIEGRDVWDNIWNLGMSPKAISDWNPGLLANGMLRGKDVVSLDELQKLLEAGFPIKEAAAASAAYGKDAGLEITNSFVEGLESSNPELFEIADRFNLGVMPGLLDGVADGFKKASIEAALSTTTLTESGDRAAATAADYRELTAAGLELGTGTEQIAFTFDGATDRLDDFRAAIQGIMQGTVGFDAVLSKAAEALKEITGNDEAAFGDGSVLPSVEVQAFGQALSESITQAQGFYSNIMALADTGSSMFALQLAQLGPEASGIVAGALELDSASLAEMEVNARMAAFLASEAFTSALEAEMKDANDSYSNIFVGSGGDLSKVREFMVGQLDGIGPELEQKWGVEHPDLPLNFYFKETSPEQIETWQKLMEGKITVKAAVAPASKTIGDAIATNGEWQTFMDSESGATITLPANLDDQTLAQSLSLWTANQNVSPEVLAAMFEQAGLLASLKNFEATAPTTQLRATMTITPAYSSALSSFALHGPRKDGGPISLANAVRVPAFATGGGYKVTGPGSGISDSILARLSAGEYVNTKKSVDFWGTDFFESLNRRMIPASLMGILGAAAVSGNQGPQSVTNVKVVQNSPVTRNPLKQLREDSERVAAGIWG